MYEFVVVMMLQSDFSKYFWSTGLTMKCSIEATPTKPAIVYIVLL